MHTWFPMSPLFESIYRTAFEIVCVRTLIFFPVPVCNKARDCKNYHWDFLCMTTEFSLGLWICLPVFFPTSVCFTVSKFSLASDILLAESHWFWFWTVWQLFLPNESVLQSSWLPGFEPGFITEYEFNLDLCLGLWSVPVSCASAKRILCQKRLKFYNNIFFLRWLYLNRGLPLDEFQWISREWTFLKKRAENRWQHIREHFKNYGYSQNGSRIVTFLFWVCNF